MTVPSRPSRRRAVCALAAALVVVLPAGVALATPPAHVLPRSQHGEAALQALGDRLPAVAAANGRSAAVLREQLRTDPTLWVDPTLRLFYVEPGRQAAPAAAQGAAAALAPLADTFALHSRPTSLRTIYLDFDGNTTPSGTGWQGGAGFTSLAYSIDADRTSFSSDECTQIQLAWQRIAEDYAPFDVDVTTQEPPAAALTRTDSADQQYGTRLVITPTDQQSCQCGGIAYVGVFDNTENHDYYQPAFVYTSGVGTSGKTIAEAGSHEVGHNLGLSHDGTATAGYYEGQGAWAPIMGVGYYRPVSQWSQGEYFGANNHEDDFAVMASHGASLLADDQSGNPTPLTPTSTADGGSSWTATGLIGNAADVDSFSIDVPVGRLSLAVDVADIGADLDARLQLVGPSGAVVATADPAVAMVDAGTATGLSASLSATVAAGRYTVRVDGVGFGSASTTGYSDYGSVGPFRLSGTLVPPPAAPHALSATVGGSTVGLAWDDVAGETGYELVRDKQSSLGTSRRPPCPRGRRT